MAEQGKYTLQLPKAQAARLLNLKPSWTTATDEEFLCSLFTRGNFDAYVTELELAGKELEAASAIYAEKCKAVQGKAGLPVNPPRKRKAKPTEVAAPVSKVQPTQKI